METQKTKVIHRVSYSLEREYDTLLGRLARKMKTSKTGALRLILDERAAQAGLRTVAELTTAPVNKKPATGR